MNQHDLHLIIPAKLEEPPLRQGVVFRSRLVERLDQGLRRRLTLVSAPAGYGKTSLVQTWIQQLPHPVAWISLDAMDNNPARFFTYLAAALSQFNPGIADHFIDTLHSQEMSTAHDMARNILQELADWSPFTLIILDDYHVITDIHIHEAMNYLIQNLPGQVPSSGQSENGCHFVFVSRNDPPLSLSRWRLNQEISEIRMADMRFSMSEAALIFSQDQQLNLKEEDIECLVERTEGWVASMQLVALSLSNIDPGGYSQHIRHLSGNNTFIADYLAEEVFSQQDADTKSFLLQSSILERAAGKLCDCVTGMNNCQKMLETLEKNNLFVIPMDSERGWYRYHPLFKDFVYNKLVNDSTFSVSSLHSSAAQWYEQNGYIEDSIKHWMEIERYDQAARVVSNSSPGILSRSQFYILKNIIEAFPDDAFQIWPWLSIYRAWAYFVMDPESVETWLKLADQVLNQESTKEIHTHDEIQRMMGDIATIRALCASRRGDVKEIARNAPRALTLLPPDTKRVRGLVLNATAAGQFLDFLLDESIRTNLEAKDILIQGGNYGGAAESLTKAGDTLFIQGNLHKAAETYAKAIDLGESSRSQSQILACCSWCGLGAIQYEWNTVDKALVSLKNGCAGSKKHGLSERITCDLTLAMVYMGLGELEKAENLAGEHYRRLGIYSSYSRYEKQLQGVWVRLLAVQGRQKEVRETTGDLKVFEQMPLTPLHEFVSMSIAWASYHLGDYEKCVNMALMLEEQMSIGGRLGRAIDMLSLITTGSMRMGDEPRAISSLSKMLQLSAKEGYIRTYLDAGDAMFDALSLLLKSDVIERDRLVVEYIRRIMDGFLSHPNIRIHDSQPIVKDTGDSTVSQLDFSELLTEHEKKVLRLLVIGHNNREIGNELSISVNTVKKHVANIYSKLNVHNRFQAAVRVSQLKIKL